MVTPQSGASAQLAGKELMRLPAHAIVQSGLALVPEGRGVFGVGVKENLQLGAQPQRARANEAKNLEQVFTRFPKLRDLRLPQAVRTMSGGEQQMVAVGRA